MKHEPHPEYLRFKHRWDRAERWWPVYKRSSRIGNRLLELAIYGSLLEMLSMSEDVVSTAFKWLVVPTMAAGALATAIGIVVGEWVLRVQRRALDEWKPTGCPPSCPCKRGAAP